MTCFRITDILIYPAVKHIEILFILLFFKLNIDAK